MHKMKLIVAFSLLSVGCEKTYIKDAKIGDAPYDVTIKDITTGKCVRFYPNYDSTHAIVVECPH